MYSFGNWERHSQWKKDSRRILSDWKESKGNCSIALDEVHDYLQRLQIPNMQHLLRWTLNKDRFLHLVKLCKHYLTTPVEGFRVWDPPDPCWAFCVLTCMFRANLVYELSIVDKYREQYCKSFLPPLIYFLNYNTWLKKYQWHHQQLANVDLTFDFWSYSVSLFPHYVTASSEHSIS